MRRVGLKPGPPPQRRQPLRPISARRAALADERATIRAEVFARDRHRCLLAGLAGAGGVPRCWGPLTPHHLRKAGQLGSYTRPNLVTLCAGHNSWVETARALARALGLEATAADTPADVWGRLRSAGLVTYDWDRI